MKKQMNSENFKNPKWHDRETYQDTRVRISRELAEFCDDNFNFEKYGTYREFLSELLERKLKKLHKEMKAKRIAVLE